MADADAIDRGRGLMALIMNNPPIDENDTLNAIMARVSLAQADKWGKRLYDSGGFPPLLDANGTPRDWDDLTRDEKGAYFMDMQRTFWGTINRADRVPDPVRQTRDAEKAAADQETETDFGPLETNTG